MRGSRLLAAALLLAAANGRAAWYRSVVDTAPASLVEIVVSSAGANGKWRVYGIAADKVYEYEWFGSSWGAGGTAIATLGTSALGIAAGTARTDGKVRLYVATGDPATSGHLYEVAYNTTTQRWDSPDLGTPFPPFPPVAFTDVALGTGQNDGRVRIYASAGNGTLYEWTDGGGYVNMGTPPGGGGGSAYGVAAGQGQDTATTYVYGAFKDGTVWQYAYGGAAWSKTSVGGFGMGYAGAEAAAGVGRKDNRRRVYATGVNSGAGVWAVREWEFSGGAWSTTTITTGGGMAAGGLMTSEDWKNRMPVSTEVYVGGGTGLYAATYSAGWSTETAWAGAATMNGPDGDHSTSTVRGDGVRRVYAGDQSGVLAQFRFDGSVPASTATAPTPGAYAAVATISGTVRDDVGLDTVGVWIERMDPLGGPSDYWNGSGWGASLTTNVVAGPWPVESPMTYLWSYGGVGWTTDRNYRVGAVARDLALQSATSSTLTILYDTAPPAALTNLSGDQAGAAEGQVRLVWTTPNDGSLGPPARTYSGIPAYVVKYSTLGITTQTEFNAATTYAQSWMPLGPGTTETRYLSGLTAGTTYYVAIEARDTAGNQATLSNATSAWAQYDITPPSSVTNLAAAQQAQIFLSWTYPGDDGTAGALVSGGYQVRYSPFGSDPPDTAPGLLTATTNVSPGVTQTLTVTGLTPRTTYYFWTRVRDERDNWAAWSSTANAIAGAFIRGQQFLPLGLQELNGSADPSLTLGDLDGDGDLDVVAIGDSGVAGGQTRVFRNDGGTFVSVQSLVGLKHGAAAFGDYDRDGDLDLAIVGYTGTTRRFIIYRNDAGTFNSVQDPLGVGGGLSEPSLAFGDLDRDGDVDLVVQGYDGTNRRLLVYRNDGGGMPFVLVQQPAGANQGLSQGSAALADLDADGDLDLIVAGLDGAGARRFRIYRNDLPPQGFVLWQEPLGAAGLTEGGLAVADVDQDGDLDCAVSGADGTNRRLLYYRNDGSTTAPFNLAQEPLGAGVGLAGGGSLTFGDVDNDGAVDLIAAGHDGTTERILVYRNAGGAAPFALQQQPFGAADGIQAGSVIPGDLDQDGDLDLVIIGTSTAQKTRIARVYSSLEAQFGNVNSTPTASAGGFSEAFPDGEAGVLRLGWGDGGDAEGADPDRLYYQVRVGTTVAGVQGVSDRYGSPLFGTYLRPRIGTGNGLRLAPAEGTTVYWAVRTVDAGFRRSGESTPERWFLVSSAPAAVTDLAAAPGAPEGSVRLTWTAPGDDGTLGTAATYLIRYATTAFSAAEWTAAWVKDLAALTGLPSPLKGGTTQAVTATGLSEGVTYYFALRARDEAPYESGQSNASSAPATTVYPLAPTGVTVLVPAQGRALNLAWTANTESDLKDYRIHRSTNGNVAVGSSWTVVAAVLVKPGTTHQDAGLTDGVTYYYRVTARDATLHESDGSAEVSGIPRDTQAPATPAGLSLANPGTGQRLNVNWSSNSESDLKDYRLFRSTNAGVTLASSHVVVAVAAPGTTHQDGGLTNGRTYFYRLTARDLTGNESAGSGEIGAAPTDVTPPVAPAGLGASRAAGGADAGGRMSLSWTADTESDLKDYRFFRASFTGTLGTKGVEAVVAAPGTTHQDAGLTDGTTFYFQVTARDQTGNESTGSNEASGYPADTVAPSSPTAPGAADAATGGRLTLLWTAVADAALKDYRIFRSTNAGVTLVSSQVVTAIAAPGTTHQDGGLTNNTTYYYRLTARDAAANESPGSSEVSAVPRDTTAPAAPTGFAAGAGNGVSTLTWTANGEADLKDYRVFRSTNGGVTLVSSHVVTQILAPGTTHLDAGLTNETTYYYRLTARDQTGNESGDSAEVSVKPQTGADTTPPTVPAGASVANPDLGNRLRLSWTANTESDLRDYAVYRSTNAGVTIVSSHVVTRILPPGVTHEDAGLTDGTTYYYRLTARDVADNVSGGSTEISAFPTNSAPAAPTGPGAAVVATGNRLDLSWTANTESDLKDYRILRSTNGNVTAGSTWTVVAATITTPGTTHQDAGLMNETTHYYRLTARDTGGNESAGSSQASGLPRDTTPPDTPQDLSAANPTTGRALNLNWSANTEGDLKDYRLFRSTNGGVTIVSSHVVTAILAPGTTRQDRGLTDGTAYFYRLTARDASSNESPGSGEVSATPTDSVAPGAPAGLAVSNALGGASAGGRLTLTWTANTEEDLRDDRLFYALSAGLPLPLKLYTATILAPGTTHQESGLVNGTTYYYQLTARDVSGNESSGSAEVSGTPADTDAPAAPAGPGVSVVAAGGALDLSWTANTEADLLDYRVYRSTRAGVTLVSSHVVTTVTAPGTTRQDAGLTNGTTYYYRLTARDTGGNESSGSTEPSGVPADTSPPSAPALLLVTDPATGRVLNLTWTAVVDDALQDYRIYRSTNGGVTLVSSHVVTSVPPSLVTDQDGGLTNGVTYFYRAAARDMAGNVSAGSPEASGRPTDGLRPAAPLGLGAANSGPGNLVDLAWVQNLEPDLKDYRVYRATFSGPLAGKSVVGIVARPGTTHQDGGLTDGTTFYYQLTARDLDLNESDGSEEAYAVPQDTVPPAAITTLSALQGAPGGEMRLTWTAPGEDGAIGTLAGNFLLRWSTASADATAPPYDLDLATVAAPGTTHNRTVTGLREGTTFYASAWAVDQAGNRSPLGNTTTAWAQREPPSGVTNLAAAPGTSEGEVALTWTAPGQDGTRGTASAYRFRYALAPIVTESDFNAAAVYGQSWAPLAPGGAESRALTGLTAGTTYYFVVRAEDDAQPPPNVGALSNDATAYAQHDVTPPAGIADLAFSTSPAGDALTFAWTAPGDDGTLGQATAYLVRYGTAAIPSESAWAEATAFVPGFTPGPSGSAETRTVTGLAQDTTYYVAVRARDDQGSLGGLPNGAFGKTRDVVPPAAVGNLSAAPGQINGTVDLAWTAPGDNGTAGQATAYDLRVATYAVSGSTTAWWNGAVVYAQTWSPAAAGVGEARTVSGLTAGATFYFAIEARDEVENQATLSNAVSARAAQQITIHHFDVAVVSTAAAAGDVVGFTLTARTATNAVMTDYTGSATFSATDPQAQVPAVSAFTAGEAGVKSFLSGPLRFRTAGGQRLTAQDTLAPAASGQSAVVQVSSAAFSQLRLSNLPPDGWTHYGRTMNPTVEPVDVFGNRIMSYGGTVNVELDDPQGTLLPGTTTFGPSMLGVFTPAVTIRSGFLWQMRVKETPPGASTGTFINAAALASFRFRVSGLQSSLTAGTPASATVEALTPVGTRYTWYRNTIHFASTDGQATLPADAAFGDSDAGIKTFASQVILRTAGTQSVTADDPASLLDGVKMTGTQSGIAVLAEAPAGSGGQPAVDHFVVEFLDANGNVTTTIPADTQLEIRVTARDRYGNIIAGFNGPVQIALSSGRITPSVVTLQAGGPPPGTRTLVRVEAGREATITVTVNGAPAQTAAGARLSLSVQMTAGAKTSVGYPNPFDPAAGPATIRYYLSDPAEVDIQIFTLAGAQVRRWTFSADRGSQYHLWDGINGDGAGVESGGYLVLIQKRYGDRTEKETVKLAILRR